MLSQTEDINLRRECVLKALIFFLGEDADDLIKEYLVSFNSHLHVGTPCQRDTHKNILDF